MFTDNYDEHLANVDEAVRSGILDSQREGAGNGDGGEAPAPEEAPAEGQ